MVREQVDFDLDNEAYLKKLGSLVERVKEEAGIQDADLLGVGISVPGLVSDDGETVIYGRTLNFTGKTRKEIAKYIPYPCRLVHDSYAAGYIEAWKNQEVRNAFYISLSNSVGRFHYHRPRDLRRGYPERRRDRPHDRGAGRGPSVLLWKIRML